MTVVIGILALIGLAVVGAIGWAFSHGVRDGLAAWREVPPGGASQPVPVGESPLSLSAALPSSYQAGQLAGEVAASWHSAHRLARAGSAAGIPASSSWAAALALGSELSQQRQEAGRAMQAAMAQVLQDNEQAVREAAASTSTDRAHGTDGSDDRDGASPGAEPGSANGDGTSGEPATGTARPTWPRLTRPRVARRGCAPGGARSSDRLGRTGGSRGRRD